MYDGQYNVEIVERESGQVVETIGPNAYHTAERVERGVNINLNHGEYRTRIRRTNEEGSTK